MLSRLTVSNLAIVERAEAEFAAGLNVLTGETGAGKSVLMGALELVLGGRADSSVVRDGAAEARVEADFEVPKALWGRVGEVLSEAGLPECEEGSLIVRRTLSAAGGGRAWVNDAGTTVATLRKLGRILVDVHGARANQKILEEGFQRGALDSFGGICGGAVWNEYAAAWGELKDVRGELEAMEADGVRADELEMLRFQVEELDEAKLGKDDEDLAERHAAAAHASEIVEAANEITEALGGDEGAAEILVRLQAKFGEMARHFGEAEGWQKEAEDLTVRLQELSRSVADRVSKIETGDDLEELDARLTVVNRLKRKYGAADIAGLLKVAEEKRARLEDLEGRGERKEVLEKKCAACEAAVKRAGAALTKARKSAAEKLGKAVTKELHGLGFLQAKFGVEVGESAAEATGCDRVAYVFEPNPGEGARELAAIASSGETARVMLALKTVLAAHDETDLLVFDEIDANIGGEVGEAVGRRMRKVAATHQVIAITHLPQSAVWGERHLVVSKSVQKGRTRTVISEVTGEDRVAEIARMLGGDKQTNVVKKHAEELLSISN